MSQQHLRTALITGATSGIGEATARRLARSGNYRLILTGRRSHRLETLKRSLSADYGCDILALVFDVRIRSAVEAALEGLDPEWREIDVLVNNAGLAAGLSHVDKDDPENWERMIDTNIKGLLYVSRSVAGRMIASGRGGHIINIGSIAGVQVYENGAVYCASKHAVHALSQGMREDFLGHGIRVSEVRPGMTETEFSLVRFAGDTVRAHSVYEGVEALTGDDIARTIEWILAQPSHVCINDIEITPTQQANAYYTFRKPQG